MAELTPSEVLARLALQSDRYATDAEYRDAVDDVLAEAKAAQQPGGWAEIDAAVRARPGTSWTEDDHLLTDLRPVWHARQRRHATELAAAGAELASLRDRLAETARATIAAQDAATSLRSELAAARAREAGLREALVDARRRIERAIYDRFHPHETGAALDKVFKLLTRALADAPAPAGGLLELLAQWGRYSREARKAAGAADREAPPPVTPREMRAEANAFGIATAELRSAIGLPPREGA
jgi:hypothetical protein